MTEVNRQWRLLLVEDNEPLAITTSQSLERRPVSTSGEYATVEHVSNFDEALRQIEQRRYDLVILDIRDQGAASEPLAEGNADESCDDATSADRGLQLYNEIRRRRFLPILFYSAVAHLAQHLDAPPFVTVVSKLGNEDGLLRHRVTDVFDSRLPFLNRSIELHIDITLRDFMIEFVERYWAELVSVERRGDLAHLMVRRLARSLDATYIAELADAEVAAPGGRAHPTRLYIMPPLADSSTGDIVHDDSDRWFVVLTPTCDLVKRSGQRKAEFVILASCLPLTESEEYRKWVENGRPVSGGQFNKLIANNRDGQRDRYYFLPAAWGIPDLIVDLQRINHLASEDFDRLRRVATLDDPYAQAVVSQFGRYAGRVGTPDLDLQAVRRRVRPADPAAHVPEAANTRPHPGTVVLPFDVDSAARAVDPPSHDDTDTSVDGA